MTLVQIHVLKWVLFNFHWFNERLKTLIIFVNSWLVCQYLQPWALWNCRGLFCLYRYVSHPSRQSLLALLSSYAILGRVDSKYLYIGIWPQMPDFKSRSQKLWLGLFFNSIFFRYFYFILSKSCKLSVKIFPRSDSVRALTVTRLAWN